MRREEERLERDLQFDALRFRKFGPRDQPPKEDSVCLDISLPSFVERCIVAEIACAPTFVLPPGESRVVAASHPPITAPRPC